MTIGRQRERNWCVGLLRATGEDQYSFEQVVIPARSERAARGVVNKNPEWEKRVIFYVRPAERRFKFLRKHYKRALVGEYNQPWPLSNLFTWLYCRHLEKANEHLGAAPSKNDTQPV